MTRRTLATLKILPPILILAAGLSGCHRQPVDPVDRGLRLITAEALLDDVEVLAGPDFSGRLAGDPGYEAAARWCARRFDRLGLAPGGDQGTYLQRLTIEYNQIQGTPALTITGPAGTEVEAVLGRDFTCRGFTGSGAFDAPVVFAGYGLSAPELGYDDYAGLDTSGKIVLVYKRLPTWQPDTLAWDPRLGTPRGRATIARRHGAAALLWFDVPRANDWAPQRGPIGSVLHGGGEYLTDMPHLEIGLDLADLLLGDVGASRHWQAMIDSSRNPHSHELAARAALSVQTLYDPARETCNVVAVLPGGDPELAAEALIIGAHLDHVGRQSPAVYYPGANDNASGVAAVLRLAEAFRNAGQPPRRSVVFVLFAGEESGLVGATHHAQNPLFAPEQTVAMFNFDCVACGDSIQIGGGLSTPELWQTARALDAEHTRRTVAATWPGGGADATPFFALGIPTLYWATTSGYAHLHAVTDTPETLNGPLFADLVRLAFRTAWAVADAPAASGPGAASGSTAARRPHPGLPSAAEAYMLGGMPPAGRILRDAAQDHAHDAPGLRQAADLRHRLSGHGPGCGRDRESDRAFASGPAGGPDASGRLAGATGHRSAPRRPARTSA